MRQAAESAEAEEAAARAADDAAAEAAAYAQRVRAAGCPPEYDGLTFASYLAHPHRSPDAAAVVARLEAFGTWPGPARGLYLYGPFGTGKSALACEALRQRLRQRLPPRAPEDLPRYATGRFVAVTQLLGELKATFGHDGEETERVLGRYRGPGLLVLDDLGAEQPTPWARAVLFDLLNYRKEQRRLTIITSNYSLGQVAARLAAGDDELSGKRIAERILAVCDVQQLRGANLRRPAGPGQTFDANRLEE